VTEEKPFSRSEIARALGLGELLVLAMLVVLAPVVRGENAYGSVHSFLPRMLVGEGYFLLMLAFLGALTALRVLAAGRVEVPEPAALALLGALFLYIAVRGSFSDHPYEARRETLAWLANLLLFGLVLISAGLPRRRRVLLAAIAASLAVQGCMAFYQHRWQLPAMREVVLGGASAGGIDPQNPAAVSRLLSGEPFTNFLHANALAGWTVTAALAAGGLCASLMIARWRDPAEKVGLFAGELREPLIAASWMPVAALVLHTLYLTGSKGAYIGLAAAVAVALAVIPPARGRAGWILLWSGRAALVLMLMGALAMWLFPSLPGRSGLAASVEVRTGYWKPAATMAVENPAFGVGPGKFGALYPRYKGPSAEESQSAHSAYMETAAEEGFLGLGLLLAFWGWVAWRTYRRTESPAGEEEASDPKDLRKCLAIVLVVGTVATAAAGRLVMSSTPQLITHLFGAVWGAAFALAAWPLWTAGGERPDETRTVDWFLLTALGAFLVHSAGSMGMSLRSLIGPALILAALGLAGPGRRVWPIAGRLALLPAAAAALAAVAAGWLGSREWSRGLAFQAIEEAAAAPDEVLGRKLTDLERRKLILDAVEGAVDEDPINWYLRGHAGRACLSVAARVPDENERRSFLERAGEHYRRAAALAPARTSPRRTLARFYIYWRSMLHSAPAEYEKLCSLYPLKSEQVLEWADAELLCARRDRALDLYRRALETSRRVGDEAIHLSILFENPNRMRWGLFVHGALAEKLDAVLAEEPERAPVLFRRAVLEVARGDGARALEFASRAAKAEPDDAQLLLFEGYCLRLDGQWEKALETFRRAATLGRQSGRGPGPGAVNRAIYRTGLARRLHSRRAAAAKEAVEK
jgi:O-antigen ligase/tetratricopeptide (TPR) repeat protein